MESNKARICVPVCVGAIDELPAAVKRAAEVGDIVELRLDCLASEELEQRKVEIRAIIDERRQPLILTLRPAQFGGARPIDDSDRLLFRMNSWYGATAEGIEYWDVEHDLALLLKQREREGNDLLQLGICDWKRTIASYHDFVGVPADLERIFEDMGSTSAAILKIAIQADDATDCIPVFKLLDRARREGRELIAIAMGQAGVMTRILGPSRGSFLTYGSLDEDSTTAPGQVTARDLREVYRIDNIDRETQIMGVIGRPVAHSISPYIHNAALAQTNLNAVFIPFEVHDVDDFMRRMVRKNSREIEWNLRGFAVTAPHKSAVMKHLDWIEPAAKEIGALNTIVVQDGELHGYNTDAAGFIGPLNSRVGSLAGARCAVIGAGGAARAVVWALRQERASVTLFCRDPEKAKAIQDQFQASCRSLADVTFTEFDIVVNATPLGTRGELETETPVTAENLRGVRLAYDLVYNPLETQFLSEARQAGCETLGGLEMLIAQAVEQFRLWTGKEPGIKTMHAAASRTLQRL
ncbi:MAG TPA: shikimate dehydrogenase [Pyrinomonadaceae bacterium]